MTKTIAEYVQEVHAMSRSKGFWPEIDPAKGSLDEEGEVRPEVAKTIPTKIALLHSELSEMLEDYRSFGAEDSLKDLGYRLNETIYWSEDGGSYSVQQDDNWEGPRTFSEIRKPCGLPTEAAHVAIRLFDLCGALGIDLEKAIVEKMKYNATRSVRHGNKAC